ncbi:hypothetical protein VMT65_18245 [Nocardia sp. CDC153]|uniref:hypothetical protein n=1 Tax=Nocardia sp. CDC153 TaxID=3112167 RepID=UPI002DBF5353|nr:hypothetical protein [Nocardia sp. CDC153]MEC3954988.1 hypothetical protein [Nocardia sp. CDC153]
MRLRFRLWSVAGIGGHDFDRPPSRLPGTTFSGSGVTALADDPEDSEYTWMRKAHDPDIRQPAAARHAISAGAR